MDIDFLLVGGRVVAGHGQTAPFVGTVAVGGERILWVAQGIVDVPAPEKDRLRRTHRRARLH